MINTKFEAYKVNRELKRSGIEYEFTSWLTEIILLTPFELVFNTASFQFSIYFVCFKLCIYHSNSIPVLYKEVDCCDKYKV